jgi:hypothetical protein
MWYVVSFAMGACLVGAVFTEWDFGYYRLAQEHFAKSRQLLDEQQRIFDAMNEKLEEGVEP